MVGSLEAVTSESSISDFLEMESNFGRTVLSDTYDPWSGLDNFGKADIMSKLDPEDKYQNRVSKTNVSRSPEVQQPPATMKYPKKNVRPTRLLSDAEINRSAKSLRRGSNKD